MLRERTRQKGVRLQERRLKLLEKRQALAKEVIHNAKLSPEEKQERIRQILGTE
jgi:hypothetical protein